MPEQQESWGHLDVVPMLGAVAWKLHGLHSLKGQDLPIAVDACMQSVGTSSTTNACLPIAGSTAGACRVV